MGMGNADLNIDYSNDSAMSARLKGKSPQEVSDILNGAVYGNTPTPPKIPTLDVTDDRLAMARANAALQLTTGSRAGSFLTGATGLGGGDKGLAARQAALALTKGA